MLFTSCRNERTQSCAQTVHVCGIDCACGEYHQATPTTLPGGKRISAPLLSSLAARVTLATDIGQPQLIPYWKWAPREAAFRSTLNYQPPLSLPSGRRGCFFLSLASLALRGKRLGFDFRVGTFHTLDGLSKAHRKYGSFENACCTHSTAPGISAWASGPISIDIVLSLQFREQQ